MLAEWSADCEFDMPNLQFPLTQMLSIKPVVNETDVPLLPLLVLRISGVSPMNRGRELMASTTEPSPLVQFDTAIE